MVSLIPLNAFVVIIPIDSAFADNLCFRLITCTAIGGGGGGGRSSDTDDAISGDIGPGGSCFTSYISTIGAECGESKGSS